ncbi:MAG: hypothetical protein MJ194_03880 [Clostridia bacterium]|nr:hypothetical protein [Clostridia bacterium]
MPSEIKTEFADGLVRRQYSSHIDYSRESNVYEKLKGTGLVAEITRQFDGFIERVFVEGPSFAELFEKYAHDLPKLAGLYEELCRWYNAYREATKLILGEAAPEKFILSKEGFVYVDFENVRPGFAEQDIAAFVKWMLSAGGDPQAAKLFVCVCTNKLELHSERLEKSLKAELEGEEGADDLIFFLICAGVVLYDGSAPTDSATASLAMAPERYIAVIGAGAASCPGFETIRTDSIRDAIAVIARRTNQRNLLLQPCGAVGSLPAPVRVSKDLALDLLIDLSEDADVLEVLSLHDE